MQFPFQIVKLGYETKIDIDETTKNRYKTIDYSLNIISLFIIICVLQKIPLSLRQISSKKLNKIMQNFFHIISPASLTNKDFGTVLAHTHTHTHTHTHRSSRANYNKIFFKINTPTVSFFEEKGAYCLIHQMDNQESNDKNEELRVKIRKMRIGNEKMRIKNEEIRIKNQEQKERRQEKLDE